MELTKKLNQEEVEGNIKKDKNELADVMEVVYALASLLHSCTAEELEKIRRKSRKTRQL